MVSLRTLPRISVNSPVKRAEAIRIVLTDCDGVLTDGGVYYAASGEEMRRFSVIDGMGVYLLKREHLRVGIVSGENSEIIRRRAEKLGLDPVALGISDKHGYVGSLLRSSGLEWHHVAYIGDDINDLELMKTLYGVGLTACPPHAVPEIAAVAEYRTTSPGGEGAFREFGDWIRTLRREYSPGDSHFLTQHRTLA